MNKKNQKKRTRKANHESIMHHLFEDEETEKFLATWNQNATAILKYHEAIVRCTSFLRKFGKPQRQLKTYGGKAHNMQDLLNVMLEFFEEHEDYIVCARLKKCKPLPSWMLNDRYQAFALRLEEFYSDATIVMSQKEGFAMIQNILQHASDFFDLDLPFNWILIWNKIIEHQRQLESLDVGALKVLEAMKDETIQFTEREKKRYEQGISEQRFFYAPTENHK